MRLTKTTLRTLIIAQFVLGIASIVSSELAASSLPDALRVASEHSEYDFSPAVLQTLLVIFILFVVLAVISWIGLFVFWRPARFLYFITVILLLLPTLLGGPHVGTGLSAMLAETVSIITGIILALIYFSPLKELYEKRQTDVA